MKKGKQSILFITLTLSILLFFIGGPMFGQKSNNEAEIFQETRSKVALIMFSNKSGNKSLDSLCRSSTDILGTTLRLLNLYSIDRLDYLLPTREFWRSRLYLMEEVYDNAIFGSISYTEGTGYLFSVSVWDRGNDRITISREASTFSLFDIFTIVDEITIEVAEAFSGQKIGFGTFEFVNRGTDGIFNVYVDGQFLGQNLTQQKVLYGNRDVRITVPAGIGEKELLREQVLLEQGEKKKILFSLAPQQAIVRDEGTILKRKGSLFINTLPDLAEIVIEGKSAGQVPVEIYGLYEGPYSVQATAPGFITLPKVIEIVPDQENRYLFQLQLNRENPEVKKLLKATSQPTLAFWVSLGIQTALVLTDPILTGPKNGFPISYLLLSGSHYATFAAGGGKEGMIINAASLFLNLAPALVIQNTELSEYPLMNLLLPVVMLTTGKIVDSIVAQRVVKERNSRRIEEISEIGIESYKRKQLSKEYDRPGRQWVIQGVGGDHLSGGISFQVFAEWLRLESLLGLKIPEESGGNTQVPFSVAEKALFFPFKTEVFQIYAGFQAKYYTALLTDTLLFGTDADFHLSPLFGFEYIGLARYSVIPFVEFQVNYSFRDKETTPSFSFGFRL